MYNFVRKFKKMNAYSTEYSQVVTHPSTNSAQCCLTAVIGRELVFSTWYGRRHDTFLLSVKELNDLLYLDKIPFWEFRRETMCVYLNISLLEITANHGTQFLRKTYTILYIISELPITVEQPAFYSIPY